MGDGKPGGDGCRQKRYQDAIKLGEEVLEAWKKLLGEKHRTHLWVMKRSGCTYRDQGRIDDSVILLEASAERKTVLGHYYPDTLVTMSDLAVVYKSDAETTEKSIRSRDD